MRLVSVCCLISVMSMSGLLVRAEDDATVIGSAVPPTMNPESLERVLLLETGKILKGVVRQSTAGYVVNVPGGQMVLPFDQVRFNAENLEELYRQQRSALPERPVSGHIDLARWCLTNGLPDQACKELREVLRIEPDSTIARTMLQRINDQLLATRDLPAVMARNGEYSMIGDPKLGVSPEPLGGLSREAALDFVSKVQPLLVNRCATAGCHGPGSGNSFELQRTKLGRNPPKSYSERNIAAVLERVDRERPLSSPLLAKLRGEARSDGLRQSHGDLSREQSQTLRNWIESISRRPEPVAPAIVKSESEVTDSKTVSPTLRPAPANYVEDDDNFYLRILRELRSSEDSNK